MNIKIKVMAFPKYCTADIPQKGHEYENHNLLQMEKTHR
jgi:hypothetical protein